MKALIVALCMLVAACGSPMKFTEDGCVLQSYNKDGVTYYAGPCVGADNKIDRVRFEWENDEGISVRATISGDQKMTVEYLTPDGGTWVEYSEKSGMLLGVIPPEVRAVLDSQK